MELIPGRFSVDGAAFFLVRKIREFFVISFKRYFFFLSLREGTSSLLFSFLSFVIFLFGYQMHLIYRTNVRTCLVLLLLLGAIPLWRHPWICQYESHIAFGIKGVVINQMLEASRYFSVQDFTSYRSNEFGPYDFVSVLPLSSPLSNTRICAFLYFLGRPFVSSSC